MALTQLVMISCDSPGCHAYKTDDDPKSRLVSDLYWYHGWLFTGDSDFCADHHFCALCGDPWSADIHQGPADTPSLHLFEREK